MAAGCESSKAVCETGKDSTRHHVKPSLDQRQKHMSFLWFCCGFVMVFLWFSYGLAMVFLWFPSGFGPRYAAQFGRWVVRAAPKGKPHPKGKDAGPFQGPRDPGVQQMIQGSFKGPRPGAAMRGHARPCPAMRGHARPCPAMPGHARPYPAMPVVLNGRLKLHGLQKDKFSAPARALSALRTARAGAPNKIRFFGGPQAGTACGGPHIPPTANAIGGSR